MKCRLSFQHFAEKIRKEKKKKKEKWMSVYESKKEKTI